jgi:5'-nucleotidase
MTQRPIGVAAPYFLNTFGTLKAGLIGLVLTSSEIAGERLAHTGLLDPIAAAAKYIPPLKAEGASIIVAVTHLAFDDDRRLAQPFPQIDLVMGGHEHFPIATTENRTLISKAGSDARWVARIDVNRRAPLLAERFSSS